MKLIGLGGRAARAITDGVSPSVALRRRSTTPDYGTAVARTRTDRSSPAAADEDVRGTAGEDACA
ncbi:MAG TPA: hypothetical protein VF701_02560, partial [Thermoanaerobaculia bacterium]